MVRFPSFKDRYTSTTTNDLLAVRAQQHQQRRKQRKAKGRKYGRKRTGSMAEPFLEHDDIYD